MFALFNKEKRAYDPINVHNMYQSVVEQARTPVFYKNWSVPDTVDGRFEMIILHMFFVLRALQEHNDSETAETFAQSLFDVMFLDMDRSLREQGVGDLGVPKHIKRMAKAFYGRVFSYEAGLEEDTLNAALHRNVYADKEIDEKHITALAKYTSAQFENLIDHGLDDILENHITWIAPKA